MESTSKDGRSIELFENVSHLTLDIILRCAFSYESQCQQMGFVMVITLKLPCEYTFKFVMTWLFINARIWQNFSMIYIRKQFFKCI